MGPQLCLEFPGTDISALPLSVVGMEKGLFTQLQRMERRLEDS